MNAIVWLALAAAAGLVGAEAVEWCKPLQRWLIARVVAVQPSERRARYREELLSELENIPNGPLTRTFYLVPLLVKRRRLASEIGGQRVPAPWVASLREMSSLMLLSVPLAVLITLIRDPSGLHIMGFFTGIAVLALGGVMRLQRIRGGRIAVWSGLVFMGIGYAWDMGETYCWWLAAAACAGLVGAILGTAVAKLRWLACVLMLFLPMTFISIELLFNEPDWIVMLLTALPDRRAIAYVALNALCLVMIVRSVREAAAVTSWRDGPLSLTDRRQQLTVAAGAAWMDIKDGLRRRKDRGADEDAN